jgi:hypothetical protein
MPSEQTIRLAALDAEAKLVAVVMEGIDESMKDASHMKAAIAAYRSAVEKVKG